MRAKQYRMDTFIFAILVTDNRIIIVIRWRYVKDPTTGEAKTDEFGEKIRESNAKVVKWSDGE